MGCTASSERKMSRDISRTVDSDHGEFLSEYQKQLVRNTWDELKSDPIGLGGDIFLRIFRERPSTKLLFPFRNETGDALRKHPQFKGHSKRFMHAVETTIQNLNALEVFVIPTLVKLGKQHVQITDHFNDYQSVFVTSIVDVFTEVLGKKCTKEVRVAWKLFFEFISNKMLEGYENGQKDVATKRNNSATNSNTNCCEDIYLKSALDNESDCETANCTAPLANGDSADKTTSPIEGKTGVDEKYTTATTNGLNGEVRRNLPET